MKIKNILIAPLIFFETVMDRIFAVISAILFLQIPQFLLLYQQRLGGHIDELRRIIVQYNRAADSTGRSLEQYLQLHLKSEISEFVSSGRIMMENIERYMELQAALNDLSSASAGTKFFVFCKGAKFEIIQGTLNNFSPGIVLSIEALIYGVIGLIAGMLFYKTVKWCVNTLIKKMLRKNNKKEVMPTDDLQIMH